MVPPDAVTIRYGHTEGPTEVSYDDSGEYLISCGHDGEVRIWKGIDDDDPNTLTIGDKAYSAATKGDILFVATDNNAVERYTFPKASPDGILLRFTGNPTCIAVSETKKFVAAGSSDFDIKVISLDRKKQNSYLGHQAPVLCVALDPNDEFLASTSCDGTLKIWDLQSEKCIKTIDIIPKSNDIGNSQTSAGLCWRPATGEDVAVAVNDGVKIYSRVTWELFHSFTTTLTTKAFQCCSFSPCGRFIAGCSADGWILAWDAETQECLRKYQHPLKSFISSLAWDPRENNSLCFSDTRGQVGLMKDVIASESQAKEKDINDLDALFENEDDHMMLDLMAEEDNKEDDAELPALKKRARGAVFQSDDEAEIESIASNNIAPIPSTLEVLAGADNMDDIIPPTLPPDDDVSSSLPPHHHPLSMTTMQSPFQSGSTPAHLSHRFMVWNGIGVVRAYNDDAENAIDVEFHNAHTHHPIHVSNMERYTMADLSDQAVVLACQSSDETVSKLKCVHFSSWDANKEWTMNMPQDEDIQSVVVGDCWLAVCTDALQVRLLSLGGVQRQIFSIPGTVVAMAAHTDQLLIVYHVTQGVGRNQCLGCMLLEVGAGAGCKPRNIIGGLPFPMGPGTTLVWLGFTAEGTPASVDSAGAVRVLNRKFCNTWNQVANTKKLAKSRHDHYWVVGLHENPQQIRCILCKGAVYPSTLPRPTLTILSYSLPMCESESEKSKLEEEYWRTELLTSYGDYLTSRGYEPDSEAKKKSQLQIQQALMRLFALCARTDNEFQAYEVCSMMPTLASVNLAIKYAARLRRIMLAQRLQEVAQEKLEEEARVVEEVSDEDDDFRREMQAGYSNSATEWSSRPPTNHEVNDVTEEIDDSPSTSSAPHNDAENPTKPIRSLSSQLAGSRRNPFKVSQKTNSDAPSSGNVLDEIKRSTPNMQRRHNQVTSEKKRKPKENSKKAKATQSTLKNLTSTPKQKKSIMREDNVTGSNKEDEVLREKSTNEETTSSSGKSGVMLFIDEKLSEIQLENPNLNGIETRKIAIQLYRSLDPDEKKKWNERAKSSGAATPVAKKRKFNDVITDDSDDVNENLPPMDEEVTNEVEAPAKNQKLSHNLDDATTSKPVEDANPRNKLSAFAYAAPE